MALRTRLHRHEQITIFCLTILIEKYHVITQITVSHFLSNNYLLYFPQD